MDTIEGPLRLLNGKNYKLYPIHYFVFKMMTNRNKNHVTGFKISKYTNVMMLFKFF